MTEQMREALKPFAEIARRLGWDKIDEGDVLKRGRHVIEAPADDIAPGAVYCLMVSAFCEAAKVEAADREDDLIEALQRIVQWSEAYPLDIFPEPDLEKARALLAAGGITLDAISAHCMRHVVEGVGKIAREALAAAIVHD